MKAKFAKAEKANKIDTSVIIKKDTPEYKSALSCLVGTLLPESYKQFGFGYFDTSKDLATYALPPNAL